MAQKERLRTELGVSLLAPWLIKDEKATELNGETEGTEMSTSVNFTKLPLSSLSCLMVLVCWALDVAKKKP